MTAQALTYADAGVDYSGVDGFKRAAQQAAAQTTLAESRRAYAVPQEWSRGESSFALAYCGAAGTYLVHVEEGLGTKSLVADHMHRLTGAYFEYNIAICNGAMAFNDAISNGGTPISYALHLAVGSDKWFDDAKRNAELVRGTKDGCLEAGCVWGGGETPVLKGIVEPGAALLSGSVIGIITSPDRVIRHQNIRHGDAIVVFTSSGVHSNGISLTRFIGDRTDSVFQRLAHLFVPTRFPLRALPQGYLTKIDNGPTYGEYLLTPTYIYARCLEKCQELGVNIHYATNITGHGVRKFMRAPENFTYIIDKLPERPSPIFDFIMRMGPVSLREMYSTFNMGMGFAIYVAEADVPKVLQAAMGYNFRAYVAGYVVRSPEKKVVIPSLGLEYAGDTLAVR